MFNYKNLLQPKMHKFNKELSKLIDVLSAISRHIEAEQVGAVRIISNSCPFAQFQKLFQVVLSKYYFGISIALECGCQDLEQGKQQLLLGWNFVQKQDDGKQNALLDLRLKIN